MKLWKKNTRKGFTIIELVAVLVILAVLSAVVVPVGINLIRSGRDTYYNNMARTIFVAFQNAMSAEKSAGQMDQLATFTNTAGTIELTGGYLSDPAHSATAGHIDETNPVFSTGVDKPFLYYVKTTNSGAGKDAELIKLLEPYISDKTILNHTILIEFNAVTGNVRSVFYSEDLNDIVYTGGARNDISIAANRVTDYQMGYYGVDTTGMPDELLPTTPILLVDASSNINDRIANALYVEALVPAGDESYTITLTDAGGIPLENATSHKPVALTFNVGSGAVGGITAASLFEAMPVASQYADLRAAEHSGGYVDGADRRHFIFRDAPNVMIEGKAFVRVFWVIDFVDYGSPTEHSLQNSIGVKYTDIAPGEIRARITSDDSTFLAAVSNVEHSYYASSLADGTNIITNARHLSNVRYRLDGIYRQLAGIDLNLDGDSDTVENFVPLTWLPTDTGFDTTGVFTGQYAATHDISPNPSVAVLNFPINNLTIINTQSSAQSIGLFGQLGAGALIQGITLHNAHIETRFGGSAGAIAGRATSADIAQASVLANVLITAPAGAESNAGGLIGRMNGGALRLSYNGGYDYAGTPSDPDIGSVRVSGHAGYTGTVNVGGLVGYAANMRMTACYNNARVNIDRTTFSSLASDNLRYLSRTPVTMTPLTVADVRQVNTGGVIGKSASCTIRGIYATNFVGSYSDASYHISSSGALIGLSSATTITDSCALKNNLSFIVNPAAPGAIFVSKNELATKALLPAELWVIPALTYDARNYPTTSSHLAANYPYPTLTNNGHVTNWEDIMPTNELIWCTPYTTTTPFDEHYLSVKMETAMSFYEYATTDMTVKFTWRPDQFTIDNTSALFAGQPIVDNGDGYYSLTMTLRNNGVYFARFYAAVPGVAPAADHTVKIECSVPGNAVMLPYNRVFIM